MSEVARLIIGFCGERVEVDPERPFTVGRIADLSIDDNDYLHRTFLAITWDGRLWWLANVGARLSATVSDRMGRLDAWLAPGGSVPIVVPETVIRFTAGGTAYEVDLWLTETEAVFSTVDVREPEVVGSETIGPPTLTINQRMVVLALVESALRGSSDRPHEVPATARAARRIGVSVTTFNRRLDKICEKLTDGGVRGLKGGAGDLASNRRARLAEFAIAARLVTVDDLTLLDELDDGA